jgi:hypothetical protein
MTYHFESCAFSLDRVSSDFVGVLKVEEES